MNYIFDSDYFTAEIVGCMTPRDLFFYRQITKYTYSHITKDVILKRINECIKNELKFRLKDKYDDFIKIVEQRQMIIHGPFINEIIWNGYSDVEIDIKLKEEYMGNTDYDNIFVDIKNLGEDIDVEQKFKDLKQYFCYEGQEYVSLNKYNIDIEIYTPEVEGESYPTIFQNKVIIKDGQIIINVNDYLSVMNKIQPVSFNTKNNDDDEPDEYFDLKETKSLCEKYDVEMKLQPFTSSVSAGCGEVPIIIMNDDNFTLSGKIYPIINSRIKSDEIIITNNDKIDKLWVDIEIQPFILNFEYYRCLDDHLTELGCNENCPFTIFNIEHFHSYLFAKLGDENKIIRTIIVEHNKLCSDPIKSYDFSKCFIYSFPPPSKYNYDIKYYRCIFNNKFDEGEFKYTD